LKKTLLFTSFILIFLSGFSQENTQQKESDTVKRFHFTPLPVVYYTPETRWAYGAVGFFSFRFKNQSETSRNSQFQLGGAYTQEKQSLFYLPFQLYWKNDQYYAFGEVGYYDYTYNFWGVGSDTKESNEENYAVKYPRIRLNYTKLFGENIYAGVRYWFDNYEVGPVAKNGVLDLGSVVGAEGGIVSSLGAIGIYDTRDNYNFPSKGTYLELVVTQNGEYFGSPFEFTRISIDYVKYIETIMNQVVALNFYGVNMYGNPPFNELAFLGGRKKMRGYYEGRYRERNLLALQGEYRIPLFWRFGAVAFGGIAAVANKMDEFDSKDFKPSYGGGIRFALDEDDKVNIRLDMGFGQNTSGFYLTIGEAF
jgi:outer membrane protein assembly factor BamA